MGTWGIKTFENDCALDWISEFQEEKNLSLVAIKFFEVIKEAIEKPDELLDSDLATEALASAELVSALLDAPSDELPVKVIKWLEKKKTTFDKGLISMFNEIVKNTDFDEDFKLIWKDYSKEEKWGFVLNCLSDYAVKSIEIILEKSELKELWLESQEYVKWVDEVNNLKNRCKRDIMREN